MRRNLGTTLLLAALTLLPGCGSDESPVAGDAGTPSAAQPCDSDSGDCYTPPTLVSGTAAGGEVSTRATPLSDDSAAAEFAAQFREPFAGKLTRAAAGIVVPDGSTLVAAVVSIGCDVPPGVDVARVGDHVEITAQKIASPMKECLAPVTTVALAPVPAGPA